MSTYKTATFPPYLFKTKDFIKKENNFCIPRSICPHCRVIQCGDVMRAGEEVFRNRA